MHGSFELNCALAKEKLTMKVAFVVLRNEPVLGSFLERKEW